jgi:hypothetical protein
MKRKCGLSKMISKNDGLWPEIESQINWNSNLITDNFKNYFKLNIYKSIN